MRAVGNEANVDPSWAALQNISIAQFLYHDRRPTFVLDLQKEQSNLRQPLPAAFVNPALREDKLLLDLVAGHSSENCSLDEADRQIFLKWMYALDQDVAVVEFQHLGFTWCCTTLANRWRIFVANTIHNPCVRVCCESKCVPIPEELSRSATDTEQSTSRVESDNVDRLDQSGNRSMSTDSKGSSTSAKAHNFFAEELYSASIDEVAKVTETNPNSAVDSSENSAFDTWSCVRTAKRNADLLNKISAFDAVGISITDAAGEIVFANNAWYNICRLSHGPMDATAWMGIFEEAEVPKIADVWKRIIIEKEVAQFQTPLKWRWTPPSSSVLDTDDIDFPVWISVWAYADLSPEGETVGCCCLLTDISQQKWSEYLANRRLTEAVERTRVLEQLSKDLVATETRFRRISDAMPHGIFTCNLAGNMLYANDAYRETFPGASDSTSLEPWWVNVPEDELARGMEVWRRIKEEHVKVSFEMSFLKFPTSPDGAAPTSERRYMTVSLYPELDEDGQIKHITGCITDISHLKLAEQTQGARADNAEESKRQLEQFIDMTSHEIRNPLSAIVHSAEEILASLRDKPENPTLATITNAIDTLETIVDCTNHSTRIVTDILNVSKLDAGLLIIAPISVQLVSAVKQTLGMFAGELKAADISQSFTIDKSIHNLQIDWVYLDIGRVQQILVNLTTNAIKFTRPESLRRINIEILASLERPTSKSDQDVPQYLAMQTESSSTYLDSRTTDDEIIYIGFSVTDSGCGLSEDEQKNLFQRFSQAGSRTHVKYGGTGLGLFISRQLCELQGGQIGLQSTPGKGSVFSFYVKVLRCAPTGKRDSKPRLASLRFENQQARNLAVKAVTSAGVGQNALNASFDQAILLVEDNLVNQKVVAKMLRAKGFTVLVANHGLEALDQIRGSALFAGALTSAPRISLVLLDIEMPVMDGLVCIRRIRKMEEAGELRCHVPVIAITANARQEQIDLAIDAGMDNVVTKPFRADALISVMTQLWEQCPS